MRIPEPLARLTAQNAWAAPFRQSDVLDTVRFDRWLRERDISFTGYLLDHLANLGVLNPIAVSEKVANKQPSDRYVQFGSVSESVTYLDLGRDVVVSDFGPMPFDTDVAHRMWWHPFQLWSLDRVATLMESTLGLAMTLIHPDNLKAQVTSNQDRALRDLVDFDKSPQREEFLRVLAVLFAVEPLVSPSITNSVRLDPRDRSIDGYWRWRESVRPNDILASAGGTVDLLRKWHGILATRAHLLDPLEKWRTLTRFTPRSKRQALSGKALLAEEFYYTAELIRRFLERYYEVTDVPEEDDVTYGPQGPLFKTRFYGKARTSDFNRSVFRQVVRDFDLDPQPRLRWLIEGSTEEGFIKRFAYLNYVDLDQQGIELIDLGGLGSLDDQRTRILLKISKDEEVFAYVSIDLDKLPKNREVLGKYATQGLLPSGYHVFDPDFEQENFAIGELATVARRFANQRGVPCQIYASDIKRAMELDDSPVGKAIERTLRKKCQLFGLKGAEWGAALADYAINKPFRRIGKTKVERPIVSIFRRSLRARASNYRFTVEESFVNDQGEVEDKGSRRGPSVPASQAE